MASKADALFLSMEVQDPSRFGIIEGETMADELMKVKRLVEKPGKARFQT
jgi:dTDP-glucose pyrophosphorylase